MEKHIESIRFVNSSAQESFFHKLTADVSSGWLRKVWWEGSIFHKLKIVQTVFTKRMTFSNIFFHACLKGDRERHSFSRPFSKIPWSIWPKILWIVECCSKISFNFIYRTCAIIAHYFFYKLLLNKTIHKVRILRKKAYWTNLLAFKKGGWNLEPWVMMAAYT